MEWFQQKHKNLTFRQIKELALFLILNHNLTYEMEKTIKKFISNVLHYLLLKISIDSSNDVKFNYTPFLIIGNFFFLIIWTIFLNRNQYEHD